MIASFSICELTRIHLCQALSAVIEHSRIRQEGEKKKRLNVDVNPKTENDKRKAFA